MLLAKRFEPSKFFLNNIYFAVLLHISVGTINRLTYWNCTNKFANQLKKADINKIWLTILKEFAQLPIFRIGY